VLDRYDRWAVLKLYSAAWLPWLPELLPLLSARLPLDGLLLRTSRLVRPLLPPGWQEGMALAGSLPAGPVLFRENGLRFEADLRHGQKTGHFLDQRENRALVRDRVRQAGSREVLDLFSCTGGFALHAAAGGARAVVSVDVSEPALATARRNFAHNQAVAAVRACAYETVSADLFALGSTWQQAGRQFDFVIADPPALAQKQADIPRALRAYERLVRLVLPLVRPGGQLLIASCSSRISAETFFSLVTRTAADLGYSLHDPEYTGHAADHPVGFAEGAYLKALFARVAS
jgi:23S rRNA (cytosine1962-C5)-methyltransferase